MKRIANRFALVVLTIAVALGGSATAAHAEVFPGDPGPGLPCVSTQDLSVRACFEDLGEHLYVLDNKADGARGEARLLGMDGNWLTPKCVNTKGYGYWVHCNFDTGENITASLRVFKCDADHAPGVPECTLMKSIIVTT